jgi:uncharacterized protein YndB with AHSA1/START domain
MTTVQKTQVTKDLANNKVVVVREFDAPLDQVWKAWTQSDLLDQWWAPRPWKARTKTMDFREGGYWLYAMIGPDSEEHWARADYKSIDSLKSFTVEDAFCDEAGNVNTELPRMHWKNEFSATPTGTKVVVEITFANTADLEKVLQMGFEEGFTAALGNLDELLQSE